MKYTPGQLQRMAGHAIDMKSLNADAWYLLVMRLAPVTGLNARQIETNIGRLAAGEMP